MAADKPAETQATALVKADINSDNPDPGLTNQEIKELYNELVSLGLESTSTREGRVTRTTFREEGIELVFEKKTGRNRISFGDDAWGFYIKIEWWEQLAVVGITGVAGGVSTVVLKGLIVKAVSKLAAAGLSGGAIAVVGTIMKMISEVCPFGEPRYIRFDPPRSKCG